MSISADDETLQIFLDESKEHLDGIENDLLAIESAGENVDEDLVNKVFRAIHSVKGGAGFFAFNKIKDLAHAMENLLGLIRKRELAATSEIISLLLKNADTLNLLLNNVENQDSTDISNSLTALKNALTGNLPQEKKQSVEKMLDVKLPDGRTIFQVSEFEIEEAKRAENGGDNVFLLTFDLIKDIQRKDKTPYHIISELIQLTAFVESKLDLEAVGMLDSFSENITIPFYILLTTNMEAGLIEDFVEIENSQISIITIGSGKEAKAAGPGPKASQPELTPPLTADTASTPEPVQTSEPEPAPVEKNNSGEEADLPTSPSGAVHTESSIRVNVKVIDQLMTLAGELVLARNQLVQNVASGSLNDVEKVSQRLDIVTTEVQDAIMSTRMQSIGIVFGKFHRIVRDLARNLGKKIDLILEGEDVDLDKTIIEAIGDPMTHLVRNAADHGLERPQERREAGKSETGTLRLTAAHKAGQVVIEIADNGAGIDPIKLRDKALAMGIYTAAQLDEMNDQALTRLIFHPGLSTAAEVTDVSGRGVGMDVVLSNLSKLGGVVDVDSVKGRGTTVRITLPLTLAIIPSLLVSEQGEQFAIPQINLVEMVRIAARDFKNKVEMIGDAAVMRLRGELLPLVRVRDVLNMKIPNYNDSAAENLSKTEDEDKHETGRQAAGCCETVDNAVNIAVVAAGDFHYGLVVESLLDSAEIVVKPLGNHLRECRTYAGATILGDGHVALILDVVGIGQKIRSTGMETVGKEREAKRITDMVDKENEQSLLLVGNGPGEQFAVPLGLVERIEKIHPSRIENMGDRRAMQYRGGTLPLLALEDNLNLLTKEETETYYVIVFRIRDREAGLIVSRIHDIMDVSATVDEVTYQQPGIFGSLIINETTTLLLDLHSIAAQNMAEYTHDETEALVADTCNAEKGMQTVLVVEDSKFFLKQIQGFVEEAGYKSLTAIDGQDALEVLEAHQDLVDLVLTDIEMPKMDGFGLTERIRSDPRFKDLPVIAVTSVMGEEAEERGRKAGIDEYMIKLDREQILDRCEHFLTQGRQAAY